MRLITKRKLNLYVYIFLALICPSLSIKYAIYIGEEENIVNDQIHRFRKKYLEAFVVTIVCIIMGYLFADCPNSVSWNKLIPTFLIALPVYGASFATEATWDVTLEQEMNALFFKTLYVIAITWLTWDILKGII
jgi:hypothetical protein